MKKTLFLLLILSALSLLVLPAQAKPKNDQEAEQAITKFEQEWADAYVKADTAALGRIEAEDYVLIDPEGKLLSKADDMRDVKSGDFKVETFKVDNLKVRFYGKTAVVTGIATLKGTSKKQDISGKYRFTDVLVRKKDAWQAVSSQVTAVAKK